MSGIIRDTPEGYDSDAPVEDPLARRLAIEQIERRRFVPARSGSPSAW